MQVNLAKITVLYSPEPKSIFKQLQPAIILWKKLLKNITEKLIEVV